MEKEQKEKEAQEELENLLREQKKIDRRVNKILKLIGKKEKENGNV